MVLQNKQNEWLLKVWLEVKDDIKINFGII